MSTHHYWQQEPPDHPQREESPTPIVITMVALAIGFVLMTAIFLVATR